MPRSSHAPWSPMSHVSDAWGLRDFSQVAPSETYACSKMPPTRPRFYAAPACGNRPMRNSVGAVRRMENRKCQLDSFDKSTTALCAERLATQASDAFTAEAARALVLGVKRPLPPPKDDEYNHIQAWHDRRSRVFEAWRP
mmetsp:Transcript_17627/g.31868  ORF Transcript_17627/g.31868 Transcript_17627/m.31868 type:complete len:140 (+) Transcript_17627:63-482(+)